MLNTATLAPLRDGLRERLTSFDPTVLALEARERALERFFSVSAGRARAGRYWRIDLESIAPDAATVSGAAERVRIDNESRRVTACDLLTAAREYPDLLARVFGTTSASNAKFGALARAFSQLGAFVHVEADAAVDDPIVVTYDIAAATSAFPYTLVLTERGARATIVERIAGGGEASFVCAATEIVTGEDANVTYAACQQLAPGSRVLATRAAAPGRNATTAWAIAELGSDLSVGDLSVSIEQPGARAELTALFFPSDFQHVDLVSTTDHAVGDSSSETIVKSAAVDQGQARFLGNIRIAPRAQGSDASLRDDALLLSPRAHIDSVPALEIGANEVKAFHGATVGAIDADQIFYMQTRGITAAAAERLIALGFFEPAIARFPTRTLREEIRGALAAKLP